MRLYHYTALYHLKSIKDEGALRMTESNLSVTAEHAGPDVVWLTSRDAWAHKWQVNSAIDKGELRIVVDVPDAVPWSQWATDHAMPRALRRSMMRTDPHWSEWYVVERAIPESEWVGVEFRPDVYEWMLNRGYIAEPATH